MKLLLQVSRQQFEILTYMKDSGLWGNDQAATADRIISAWIIAHEPELLDLGIDVRTITNRKK